VFIPSQQRDQSPTLGDIALFVSSKETGSKLDAGDSCTSHLQFSTQLRIAKQIIDRYSAALCFIFYLLLLSVSSIEASYDASSNGLWAL
jgi:hypothetical protein